jgi:hypothetical protein
MLDSSEKSRHSYSFLVCWSFSSLFFFVVTPPMSPSRLAGISLYALVLVPVPYALFINITDPNSLPLLILHIVLVLYNGQLAPSLL